VDAIDLVDHILEQIPRLHAACDAAEDVGHHLPPAIPIRSLKAPHVGDEPGSPGSIRKVRLILVDEFQEVGPAEPVLLGRPVSPAVGGLDDRAVLLPLHLGTVFPDDLVIVEELQEEHPGQERQPIQVAVEPLVLPHDVAGGLDEATEPLGGGEG
jgi:hypothetical protein